VSERLLSPDGRPAGNQTGGETANEGVPSNADLETAREKLQSTHDELQRTIEQANRSRDLSEAIVDTVRESLVVLDPELRVRSANRAFIETFQIPKATAVGVPFFDLTGGWAGSKRLQSVLEEAVRTGGSVREYDFEVDLPEAGRKAFVANARPVLAPNESEPLLLLAIDDVTDRRLAGEKLRTSETQYRRLFETSREAIWLLDEDSGEILDVNPFALQLFGYSREEFLGRKPWELPLYVEPSRAVARFENLRKSGHTVETGLEMLARDGRRLQIEAVRSVYSAGAQRIVQSNMRDLSDRKRLEEQLRHSQRMESVGRLAGGIAHDFNNILNIISAYATLLAQGQNPSKVAQSTDAIEKAVQRGAALVRQLLTFARKEEGKFESVDVNGLVGEMASMIGETFSKSVLVSLELAPELPRIKGDPSQLHQALLNLSVNARDAMPDGGVLTFRTSLVAGGEAPLLADKPHEDSYVCITASDTGVGMDAATRNRIFEPFFTTKGREGSGLGLSVVYGVIESHDGSIAVESEPAKGSRFSLYLPAIPFAEARERPRRRRAIAPAAGGTILLVEDETPLLDSVRSLLESEGFRVLTASDGIEAVETFRRNRDEISVVLADLELPRLGGWHAFLEMRKEKPELKAIIVSGTMDSVRRDEMFRNGVRATLRKPYSAAEMLRAVREALADA
jgi:two-component system cell cycle sensor histidine kinase/response regulator CckA